MKIFSIIIFFIQLVLIGCSYYFGHLADVELKMLSASTPTADFLDAAQKVMDYRDLETLTGISAGMIWFIAMIVLLLKKAANPVIVQFTMFLPVLIWGVISFI